jgi:hypothetical protein
LIVWPTVHAHGQEPKARITTPPAVLLAHLGPTHAFRLQDHGPDPVFDLAGYRFRVEAIGLRLADKFYYDVPVYVARAKIYDGTLEYRLYSTDHERPSVSLTLLGPTPSARPPVKLDTFPSAPVEKPAPRNQYPRWATKNAVTRA